MSKRILIACAALALAGACASQRSTVSTAQLARVPPDRLGGVNNQRLVVASADDAVARQELAVQSTRNELRLAEGELKTADAAMSQAKLAIDDSGFRRDGAALQRARMDLEEAQARRDVARAHVQAAKAGIRLAEAQRNEAKQRLALAQAQLDWEKFQSLQSSRDPAAYSINTEALLNRLRDRQVGVRDAVDEVARRQDERALEQQQWRAAAQRYDSIRGYGGSGSSGDGRW